MLKKQISFDLSVTESEHIQVRQITRIMEDDIEIGKTYHRHILNPGDDLKGQDKRVVAVAEAVWTPAVIEAYLAAHPPPEPEELPEDEQ